MSVGLYDADMAKYAPICFNIDLMKLAAYYKKNHQLVIMTPEFTPYKHTNYFFRQDYNDGIFPDISQADNVEYGGLAFSNGIYIPMDISIETCIPDTSIYYKVHDKYWENVIKSQRPFFNQFVNAEHLRLSLDGATIMPNYDRQIKSLRNAKLIMLHDNNLAAVNESFDVIQDLLSKAKTTGNITTIGTKFPIQTNTADDLLKWASLPTNTNFFLLQHNGLLDNQTFCQFMEINKTRNIYKQMDYVVTSGFSQNDFIETQFPKLLKQVIISRSYRVYFSLKYEENFFFDSRWERVIDLLNAYQKSTLDTKTYYNRVFYEDTVYNFARNTLEKPYRTFPFSKQQVREVFAFVRDNNPQLFNDFYTLNFKKIEGELYDWS